MRNYFTLTQVPAIVFRNQVNAVSKSSLSSSKEIFDIAYYNRALATGCFKDNISYMPDLSPSKRKRHRKVLWFTLKFSLNIKTRVGKIFFSLVDRHFPRINRFNNI